MFNEYTYTCISRFLVNFILKYFIEGCVLFIVQQSRSRDIKTSIFQNVNAYSLLQKLFYIHPIYPAYLINVYLATNALSLGIYIHSSIIHSTQLNLCMYQMHCTHWIDRV